MPAVFIGYDLNSPGQNYAKVHEAIKSLGAWCKPLESTWVVSAHGLTAENANAKLKAAFDSSDQWWIVDISGDDNVGWLPRTVWEWLSEHV